LVLVGLHTLGYRDLHALTYGLPDSEEYRRARAVTESIGVPHHFVDYRRPDLLAYVSEQLPAYTAFAANAQSVPQEQEWPAMYAARQIEPIEGGVFLLGLGGDTFGGAPVPQHYLRIPGRLSTAAVRDWMIHRYSRFPVPRGRTLLAEYLPPGPFASELAAVEAIRDWLVRERLAKYMFNGLRSYEFEKRDWYLPLWDRALREFWSALPLDLLRRRQAYRRWAAKQILAPAGALLMDEPLAPGPVWRTEWVPPAWRPRPKEVDRDPNGLHELFLPAITAAIGTAEKQWTINEWMGRYTSGFYRK
jgi:asparagine synthetase B (glutamine-hydrolysing)